MALRGKFVALFKFFMTGTSEAPVLDLPVNNLSELHAHANRARFLEGEMVEIDGRGVSCRVLIPVSRIQMVAETDVE